MQKQKHQNHMLKMKNSLASNIAQNSDVHRQKSSEKQTVQDKEQKHINNHQEPSDKFQEYTVKISRPETSSSLHKRMKLKDYLHLKDLQKKNMAHNGTHLIDSSETHDCQKQNSSISFKAEHSKQAKEKETSAKPLQSHQHKEEDNVDLIKDEVDAKIEQQINKLSDLQKYLKRDFVSKDKKTKTFVFLFTMYNKLIDMHKINEEIGDMVIDYGNQQENKHTYLQPKSSGYHWEGEKQNLVSSAKIPNQRLERIRNSHHLAEKK